ncbi:MAG: hypothetical protein GXX94_07555 [Chloroflexi bacterium]|nr:hypothetical protein [Chloroflexota bacterium]
MIRKRLPASLWIVAILQFVAPLLLPPSFYAGISPALWIVVAVVFALLGINLLRLKDWARVATIFVQGFSILVRLLTGIGNVIPTQGAPMDSVLLISSICSMLLSGLILFHVDQPDIQLLMQQ